MAATPNHITESVPEPVFSRRRHIKGMRESSCRLGRAPLQWNMQSLRAEGVQILLGPGGIEPHQPHTGGSLIDSYPWNLALDELEDMVSTAD